MTAFSFTSPSATGTIDEGGKTIAVTVPYGTNVSALIATFTTTGASVKVGPTIQVSGVTTNDFTSSVEYTVAAADATTATYAVTVTVASPGTLDTSFGTSGKTTTGFGTIVGAALAAAIQSDGKIVAAGISSTGTATAFALTRYNTDGTLDTSFGAGGKVTTAFGTSDDRAYAVAIQTDGKIVAAGASNMGTAAVFALTRYNTDGTLDTSFGTGGKVTTAIGIYYDILTALGIQADGKIVAAGFSNIGTANVFALARYNSDGSLDTSFGTGGKVTTAFGTSSDRVYGIAIQADGKIVAAGDSWNFIYSFALARYNTDGTLDTSFGTGGKVTTAIGPSYNTAFALAIQADGKVVAAGFSDDGAANVFALARYNTDGSLDTSFGTGGKVTTAFGTGDDRSYAVAIQTDGKIVAVGASKNGTANVFALSRYNTNGILDASFGTGGKVTTPFGSINDRASAVVMQADGKTVAAGYSWTSTTPTSTFALSRYWP